MRPSPFVPTQTASWSFSTLSEKKALLISSNTGADVWIKGRLGTLGFTVNHVDHDSVTLADADGVELVYRRPGKPLEELPCVRAEALDVATLTFGVERIECE